MGIFEDLVARVELTEKRTLELGVDGALLAKEVLTALEGLDARLDKLEAPAPVPVPEPTPTPTPVPAPTPIPVPTGFKMGINLTDAETWSRERIFNNSMLHGSSWRKCVASSPTNPWEMAGAIPPLSNQGLPVSALPAADGSSIRTDIHCDNGQKYLLGTYKLYFEGAASVQLKCGSVSKIFTTPGDFTITTTDKSGITLVILKNDPANPIKNLTLHSPAGTSLLEPKFVNFMKPFKIVRFMDLMETNASSVTENAVLDYAVPHHQNGMPLAPLTKMVEAIGAAPWICLPHLSTDSYNKTLAEAIKASALPVIYLEYSNELWNSQFSQCNWLYTTAAAKGIDGALFWAQEAYRRFKIWADVFGTERIRLKFVVAGQNANVWHAKTVTAHMTAMGLKPDVISSAPYFSKPGTISTAEMATKTADQVADIMLNDMRTETIPRMKTNVDLAKSLGLPYIAYECGQHFTIKFGEIYPQVYYDVQKHPKMKVAYKEFIAAAKAMGVDGLCIFNSCQLDKSSGCWGLVQDTDQDPMASIKYQAVMESISHD